MKLKNQLSLTKLLVIISVSVLTRITTKQIPTYNAPKIYQTEKGTKLYTGSIVNMTTYYNYNNDSIPEKITRTILGPFSPAIKQIIPIEVNDSTITKYKQELKKLKQY